MQNAIRRAEPARDAPPLPARLANALRVLAMDAVQQANSGHPGMPMGMADVAEVLWNRFLRHNPTNPAWANRDRFVVSNGHGSMLLYALLHLSGYDLPLDELRRFRQLRSRTPGHPERGVTPGVETTTGPLGQGLANGVGMALAERLLAAEFNRPGFDLVDHFTYVLVGDGCLMEGISHEAASLAGTLGLGKLVVLYDDNGISIDGRVEGWFRDDTARRFEAYGWDVVRGVDGHSAGAVAVAIEEARELQRRPTLICCRTVIGKGAPRKAGSHEVHGAPLGADEIAAARLELNWPHAPFEIPDDVRAAWDARERGAAAETRWTERFHAYERAYPELAAELRRRNAGTLPTAWRSHLDREIARAQERGGATATRKASQAAIGAVAALLPELVGGSADLTGSNLTRWPAAKDVDVGGGNYVRYGVREFGMFAVANGLALHGGLLPFAGTFLVFSDYGRSAIRMAALMKLRSIFVLTHDSLMVGEDGPTHQPVEHAATLRLVPNLDVWRPADAVETLVAWRSAVERSDGPTALLLSRQDLPAQLRAEDVLAQVGRGGYVLSDAAAPSAVIVATGSEVALAIAAQRALADEGIPVRVVSMPCTGVFDRQPPEYRDSVLPAGVPRVAVEAGVTDLWRKYVGLEGAVVGLDTYGESAPAADLAAHFGFTPDRVARAVRSVLRG
ncbi:MAG TPA: transketolase [Anaeromyxobacteraceae bacterium]|nr:transketolase [Anaeromyxobacteraceae bacterium]